jgi:hypothetical protein
MSKVSDFVYKEIKAIYGPMIYTALYVMLYDAGRYITRANGRGWALEIETFLGLVKWH